MQKFDFNAQWNFYKQDEQPRQVVDLPHDAMIHEIRDPQSPGGPAVAFFPGGVYLYEKTFQVPLEWQEKVVFFEFEGVYRNSKVFVNDKEAGSRPYGYSRFFVQADRFLQFGKENTIRVVVDNSQMPNSRWYSGSGIYRPVYLVVANKTHIEIEGGVKISTLSYAPPKVLVETKATGGEVHVEILDGEQVIAAGDGTRIEFTLENARLWSAEAPNLYRCRVTLTENGRVVDEVTETFGIRKVEWSKAGLFINGKETLLRGGCVHHDHGILGAATYDKAEERRVRILKEAGFNAIRSAHNPASRALLEACDRYGMYVIDEAFDMWYIHKTRYDYATDFNEWYLEDLRAMIERDFNHPSVIMYSIGNEVTEPYQERGVKLTREMVDFIHKLDRNRAVTGGINLMLIYMASKGRGVYKEESNPAGESQPDKTKKPRASGSLFFNILTTMIGTQMNRMANSQAADRVTSPCLDALDIAGYNYASGRYPLEGKKHLERVLYGSETFTQDIAKNWEMVKKYPYLVGDFMWTAWDYLGEAGMGVWSYDGYGGFEKPYPYLIAGCGAVDILGNVDVTARYAAIVWGLEKKPVIGVRPVNHPGRRVTRAIWRGTNAIESWSWKHCEGNRAEIEVFADAYAMELFLNGKSLGKKQIKAFKTVFKTKYMPGSLRAVAYDRNGHPLSESELTSATGKLRIAIIPEESQIQSNELIYIKVHLIGENGVVESNDDRKLTVRVEGGELLGFGSANPCTEERFDSGSYTTYYGKALLAVKAGLAEKLRIHVNGDGLEPVVTEIKITDGKQLA